MKQFNLISFVNFIKKENNISGYSLKTYCNKNNLNYTNTSRILSGSKTNIKLHILFKMIGLLLECKLPIVILDSDTNIVFEIFDNLDELQKLKDELNNLINNKGKK